MIAMSIFALIAMGGCSDDDNPINPGSDPLIFVIDVNVRIVSEGNSFMEVGLAMENPGQVPSFEANGEEVPYFSLYGDNVSGSLRIPLADTLEFTIKSRNREITRSIMVPLRPEVVVLNGVELVERQGNLVEATGGYEFAWSGGKADYYDGFLELYDQELGGLQHWTVTEDENWTVEEPNGKLFGCSISAHVGSRGEPGEDPLYTTTWAEGFVFAHSYGTYYYFGDVINGADYSAEKSALDRLEELLNERTRGGRNE